MEKGNVNGALKLLTSNISNGILPLDDKTLSLLKLKHPTWSELNEEVLLGGEKPSLHPVVFEDIDENMVKEAALKNKSGSGPSGLDADGRRKILVSKSYGTINAETLQLRYVDDKVCYIKYNSGLANRTYMSHFASGMLPPTCLKHLESMWITSHHART